MTHDSPEFDAALAVTELEKSKADGIKSLIAASKASAHYQARAEKAEAALARVAALHVIEEAVTARPWCASDKMLWPCPTTRALGEPK